MHLASWHTLVKIYKCFDDEPNSDNTSPVELAKMVWRMLLD